MDRPLISFIIPSRRRSNQLDGLFHNLNLHYGVDDYEIILAEQSDDRLFRRGQLLNLGFKKSQGEYVVLQDIDVRHLERVDFKQTMLEVGKPFLCFKELVQLAESPDFSLQEISRADRSYGFGACAVFNRDQFEQSHGFSNLPAGWGAEDNIMSTRVGNYHRLNMALGHVQHSPDQGQKARVKENAHLYHTESSRDPSRDSFRHTISKEEGPLVISRTPTALLYRFSEISVSDDFGYPDLVERR